MDKPKKARVLAATMVLVRRTGTFEMDDKTCPSLVLMLFRELVVYATFAKIRVFRVPKLVDSN